MLVYTNILCLSAMLAVLHCSMYCECEIGKYSATEVDLGRGNKRRLERMEYTQRLSLR